MPTLPTQKREAAALGRRDGFDFVFSTTHPRLGKEQVDAFYHDRLSRRKTSGRHLPARPARN